MDKIKRSYWSDQEIALLIKLTASMSFEDMAKQFTNRTPVSLQKRAVKLGLKSGFRHKNHSHNINFWAENTLETAYFAGICAADANLSKTKKVFQWNVKASDASQLDLLKDAVSFTGKVAYYERLKYKSSEIMSVATLSIAGCHQWYEDLKNIWSITPNKTFSLQPPNITNENLIWAYIVGFVDGDGWIIPKTKRNTIRIGFVNASLDILNWIKKQIDNRFEIFQISNNGAVCSDVKLVTGEKYYTYHLEGIRAMVIFDFLSQIRVPKLERKWSNPEVLKIVSAYKEKYPQHFLACKSII